MGKYWLGIFACVCACAAESPTMAPLEACSAALPKSAMVQAGAPGSSTCAESPAALAPVDDLTAEGYTVLSKAYEVRGAGPYPHGIDVMFPYDNNKSRGREREIVVLAKKGNAPAHPALITNLFVDASRGNARFHTPSPATFQLAMPTATAPKTRKWSFRALAGVSMGGIGSSMNFWMKPERYDAIGVMGADPGPDLTYSLGMIKDFFVAGFCRAEVDGVAKIGQLCPPTRPLLTDQYERMSTFENFLYEPGEGVGLTLRRRLYVRANRDLARAFGNGAYYNKDSMYLPPGVPASYLAQSNAEACAKPVVLKNFFDRSYNPDGARDVITFCDGNDSSQNGYGKFDSNVAADNPVQILLAVDVNKNGKRDSGEPVIVQGNEPFQDVGTDGKASKDEPGYDAATNPDPAGDDYHYLWNPTGKENNWRFDEGEPYEDLGVDGVAMTCQQPTAGCFDFGEGNGKFDYTPGQLNWRAHDPRALVEKLTAAQLARLDVYYDAGIRDFFNAQVSSNSLMAAIAAMGIPVRAFDGFPILEGLPMSQEAKSDLNRVDFRDFGRAMYVRYGDPDAAEAIVEATGDGRHVGTASQAIHRAQALMFFMAERWPGGDRKIAPVDSARSRKDDELVTANGRKTPFTVVVPPGYFLPENANKRYPVVYFMHGYGMEPDGLAAISLIAQNAMVDDRVAEDRRMQKFILVMVDAKCRPGGEVGNEPLPQDGDLCEEGAFYTDHPDGAYKGETMLLELQNHIEMNYRTRAPEEL